MSIRVTDFKWEKGKNDLEYIAILEKNLDVMMDKFRECSKVAREQYNKGKADLKKEYEDLIIGLTKEEVRRLRVETIDECISKIKEQEERSCYYNACYEICNELEKLKHQ